MRRNRLAGVAMLIILVWSGVYVEAQINSKSVWPMFRHDRKHTGSSPYTGPTSPTVQWTFQTGDGVASSPSIGEDGTIYVGSGWHHLVHSDSNLYAINPDGTLKWEFPTGKAVFSSPAIGEDGAIYFGSLDKNFYVVEDSGTYAKMRWSLNAGHWIMNSPIIAADSTVYFGSLNFRLFAADYYGNLKWVDTLGWCVWASSAIDDNGFLIVGSKDHKVYKYDDMSPTHSVVWQHPVGQFYDGHLVDASPAIGPDGTIYVGVDQFGAAGHAGQDVITPDTAMFALNPDGTRKWSMYIGNGVESSIGIGKNNMIYFGSLDSFFYAVRDMGTHPEIIWTYKTGGSIDASPTIGGDGTIYIGSRDSTMYAFNPDGTILWTFDAGGDIESSVTINGDGIIYFGGMDGKVYALGEIGLDAGPVEIGIPEIVDTSSIISPYLKVGNFRTGGLASYNVQLQIDTGGIVIYNETSSITDQPIGQIDSLAFPNWTAGSEFDYSYNVTAITTMAGDANLYNDTLLKTVVTPRPFVCGDANASGTINILDITYIIAFLYQSGPAPNPIESGDADNSGAVNILDITRLIAYLYSGGQPPVCP